MDLSGVNPYSGISELDGYDRHRAVLILLRDVMAILLILSVFVLLINFTYPFSWLAYIIVGAAGVMFILLTIIPDDVINWLDDEHS